MKDESKCLPHELPEQVDITIYTHYCVTGWQAGDLAHYSFNCHGDENVLIAETPVTVRIPRIDFKKKLVEGLQTEMEKQKAEHFKKMKELQDKLDSLLCLEYQPEVEI